MTSIDGGTTARATGDLADEASEATDAPSPVTWRWSPQELLGLIVSCLVVVIAFSPVLFFGHTLSAAGGGRAAGTNGSAPFPGQPYSPPELRVDVGASTWALEPWAEVTSRAYANGEIPLWNPYQAAGAPHAANMQSAVFDPLLLAVNLHPTPLIWDLAVIGAFLLGAASAYVFARVLGLRIVPAVATSATFSISGWFFLYSNNSFSRSYVFLPMLFLLVELVLRSRRLLPVLGLGVAVAANIYVGMPEASFFVIGSAFLYAAVRLVQERAAMPIRTSLAHFGGAAALGLMLAAPLLLLFLQYESLSFNAHKPELERGADADSGWELLHWFVPWFPGAAEPPRNWVGAAVAVSALVALSGRRETKRLHAWLFLVLGSLVLAKIYDPGLFGWIGDLPVAGLVVYPVYAAPVASFAFAVLAGIGLHVLWARDLRVRRFLLLLGAAATVLLVALGTDDRLRVIVEDRQTVWLRGALFAALAVAAVVLSSVLSRRWPAALLAGVIVIELFWLAPFTMYAKRADPYVAPGWMPLVRAAQDGLPHSRVFATDGKLHPNTAGALALQDIRVLDAMYVERYFRYLQTFIQPDVFDRFTGWETNTTPLKDNPMFDALAVRVVLSERDLSNVPGLRLLGRDLDTRVYEKTNAYPRAWIVHEVHRAQDEDAAFTFLKARARKSDGAYLVRSFDPRREAVVEQAGDRTDPALRALQDGGPACKARPRDDQVTIERYSGDSVTLLVDAACPGLLVLPDTYFPGWKATVNGEARTIYATDGAFRGVAVPDGASRVQFRYEPRAFSVGIAIAVVGLLTFLVVWLVAVRRRRSLLRRTVAHEQTILRSQRVG